jgi:ArsR family transcriptional regulator
MENNINFKDEAKIFKALMHPTRIAILEILRDGEACVCHINSILGHRQAYISQQLSVLKNTGIVEVRRDGWNIYYRIVMPNILEIIDGTRAIIGKGQMRIILKSDKCKCPKCISKAKALMKKENMFNEDGRRKTLLTKEQK